MAEVNPLDYICTLCRVLPGEECRWKMTRPPSRFHKCRYRTRLKALSPSMKVAKERTERAARVRAEKAPTRPTVKEPPDTEEWRRGQHRALHKLRKEHDCAAYPAIRLPLIHERQLVAR